MIGADNQQATRQSAGESSETICRTPHLNGELARFVALLFTDGCVSPKGKSWRIYFVNKSVNLIDLFRECAIASFAISYDRVHIRSIKNTNKMFAAVINSKEIGNYLVERFGTFRTLRFSNGSLPNTRLPVKSLIEERGVQDFLRTAFSCDGGVSLYPASRNGKRWLIRTVFLSCAHPKLRSDYMLLLDSLGITARNVSGDNKIKIEDEINITRFREKVGFIEETMITDHSRYWRGYEKQNVLNLILASYSHPKTIFDLPQFRRDDDIVQPA